VDLGHILAEKARGADPLGVAPRILGLKANAAQGRRILRPLAHRQRQQRLDAAGELWCRSTSVASYS
jgi:hypothetical protein